MGLRPTSGVIENLRIALQQMEQNFDSSENEPAVAELRRILLIRIADLEAAVAQEPGNSDADGTQAAGDSPLVVVAEANSAAEATRTLQLDKLD